MATFHCEIKSGRKGAAADHAAYIARQGCHHKRGDLLFAGHGNLPEWTSGLPNLLWKAADRYERSNGAAYRELVIALPRELCIGELRSLVERMVAELVGNKPYQYAVHLPAASLEGEGNPHLHLMYSDRLPDDIYRPAEQTFARYNSTDPTRGGCKKDNSGRTREQVREDLILKRKTVADIQNEYLAKNGCSTRVDHRTLKEQGKEREAERHLGRARINRMSAEEKAAYVSKRKSRRAGDH
jgi:hypothetical protein